MSTASTQRQTQTHLFATHRHIGWAGCLLSCRRGKREYTWCKMFPPGSLNGPDRDGAKNTGDIGEQHRGLFPKENSIYCWHVDLTGQGMYSQQQFGSTLGSQSTRLQPVLILLYTTSTLPSKLILEALLNIWAQSSFPVVCRPVLSFLLCIWNLPWSSPPLSLENLPAVFLVLVFGFSALFFSLLLISKQGRKEKLLVHC